MDTTLALNTRTHDHQQRVRVAVVLPDFSTLGYPHAKIDLSAALLPNGNLSIEFAIRREDNSLIHSRREAFRPDELIHNAKTRKKES